MSYPHDCIECGCYIDIDRDHRTYRACSRISPLYFGIIRDLDKLPYFCPRKHGYDGFDIKYNKETGEDEWKPYRIKKEKEYIKPKF